jgi:tRNA pseudouridine32 synthase/23S rRNA pseudouridine746 synthase
VVLFAKQTATCAAYHGMFAGGDVTKTYEAIAPFDAAMQFPMTHASVLVEGEHFMQMREASAQEARGREPNTCTEIALIETRGALARYRLRPVTGKRHQLRVHMAALGLPILGDRIYPALLPQGGDEAANPLRLLAQAVSFIDPVNGLERRFSSRQALAFPSSATN